jgi:hypothetical protein
VIVEEFGIVPAESCHVVFGVVVFGTYVATLPPANGTPLASIKIVLACGKMFMVIIKP